MRLFVVALLVLALACNPRPVGVAVGGGEEPPGDIRQSDEPFVENPRFCASIGNACAVQPTPC
jgi:hypothetical protein